MELQIGLVVGGGVLRGMRLVHLLQQLRQRLLLRRLQVLARALGGKAKHQGAQLVELQHFAPGNLAHKHPPVGHGGDQAQTGEDAHGLADRAPADAHFLRQHRLVDALAGGDQAVVNARLERLRNRLRQALVRSLGRGPGGRGLMGAGVGHGAGAGQLFGGRW